MQTYDKLVRPTLSQPGPNTPDELRVGFYISNIWDVDPVAETFWIEGYLRLSWRDPRLAFNVSAENRHKFPTAKWAPTWWNGADGTQPNIIMNWESESDTVKMLWDPVLYVKNSVSQRSGTYTAGLAMIASDGTVMLSLHLMDQVTCRFDFAWFPYDSQTLITDLGMYYYDTDEVKMVWMNGGVGTEVVHAETGADVVERSSEWLLETAEFVEGPLFISSSGGLYQSLEVQVSATRQSYMWQRSYIWPSTFIVLLSFMGLMLDPTKEMRSGMHVIALLTQVTLLSSLMSSMPSVGYQTWMVGWTVDMLLLTAIMLMECIVAAFAKHRCVARFTYSSSIAAYCKLCLADHSAGSAGVWYHLPLRSIVTTSGFRRPKMHPSRRRMTTPSRSVGPSQAWHGCLGCPRGCSCSAKSIPLLGGSSHACGSATCC